MATNPFTKKTWQKRLTQYPTRRTLTDTTTGDIQTVDFARAEGEIYEAGDGFTDSNMNDLEDRIYEAFDNVSDLDHTIPRHNLADRNITKYYQDGTLWDRLNGINGFSRYEDIFVGDFFFLSRPISGPCATEHDPQGSNEQYFNAEALMIIHLGEYTYACPCTYTAYSIPSGDIVYSPMIGFFGKFSASSLYVASGGGPKAINQLTDLWTEIGSTSDAASTEEGASITAQLKAELGNHVRSRRATYSDSLSNGEVATYTDPKFSYLIPFTDAEIYGFSLCTNEASLGKQFDNGCEQLQYFKNELGRAPKTGHSHSDTHNNNSQQPIFTRIAGHNSNVASYASGNINPSMVSIQNFLSDSYRSYIGVTGKIEIG